MGEAYRTWIILPYQSTVCARDVTCFFIYQDVKTKASNLGGIWLSYNESVSFFYFFLLKKIQPQIVLNIVLIFRAISASMFLLSLFLI